MPCGASTAAAQLQLEHEALSTSPPLGTKLCTEPGQLPPCSTRSPSGSHATPGRVHRPGSPTPPDASVMVSRRPPGVRLPRGLEPHRTHAPTAGAASEYALGCRGGQPRAAGVHHPLPQSLLPCSNAEACSDRSMSVGRCSGRRALAVRRSLAGGFKSRAERGSPGGRGLGRGAAAGIVARR